MSTWVLLRGLMREARHWGDFPQQLSATVGANVLAVDLPGNGRRNAETSPVHVAGNVLAVRVRLRELGVQPPYRLLAMSYGAMVAIEWNRLHASEIAQTVLINTSVRGVSRFHQRLRPDNYLKLLRMPFCSATRQEQLIYRMTSNGGTMPAALLAEWVQIRASQPVTRRNALRQLLSAARYALPETAPAQPLILASTRDRLVNVACSRALAQRWRCSIVEHAQAGHDLPLDDPGWVIAAITAHRSTAL